MPELPEVETVMTGLAPFMDGARIGRLELRRKDLRFPFPQDFSGRTEGRLITGMGRRAKYLLIRLEDDLTIISHLGMSGSYRIETDGAIERPGDFHMARSKLAAHDHVVFHLDRPGGGGARIVYNDPRRFGFMDLTSTSGLDSHPSFHDLGPEPTGNALSAEYLAKRFSGRSQPLKSALLDQKNIAGLGNIYVCEALFRAKLSPERAAGTLVNANGKPAAKLIALEGHIRTVIAEAILAGGSSLRDHIQTDGSLGYFQHSFKVYDSEGAPCPDAGCSGVIARITQAGRSTFYCPKCQK